MEHGIMGPPVEVVPGSPVALGKLQELLVAAADDFSSFYPQRNLL
jgi:hypothetical protein